MTHIWKIKHNTFKVKYMGFGKYCKICCGSTSMYVF